MFLTVRVVSMTSFLRSELATGTIADVIWAGPPGLLDVCVGGATRVGVVSEDSVVVARMRVDILGVMREATSLVDVQMDDLLLGQLQGLELLAGAVCRDVDGNGAGELAGAWVVGGELGGELRLGVGVVLCVTGVHIGLVGEAWAHMENDVERA